MTWSEESELNLRTLSGYSLQPIEGRIKLCAVGGLKRIRHRVVGC